MDTQPLQQVPRSQEFAGRLLFVIILFLFLNGPGNQAPAGAGFPSARDYAQERITRSRQQLDVLNRTRWQDFAPKGYDTPGYEPGRYVNLTGFRDQDDYNWRRLGPWKERCDEFSKASRKEWVKGEEEKNGPGFVGQVYNNITGVVVGEWVRYEKDLGLKDQLTRHLNLTEISPHTDWAFTNEKFWTRNITGQEGKLLLRIDEKDVEELDLGDTSVGKRNAAWVREVGATMTIQDETSSGDGWEMRVHGVHWPRTGVVLMTTTSDKFAGVFGLPHLATNAGYYTSSQKLLNMTLEKTVERMEKAVWIDPSNPWTSSPDSQGDAMMPTPHCEFLVYAQVHPVVYPSISPRGENSLGRQKYIGEIEQELRFPNGAPIPPAPELKMSTVIFSPDCGFILESKGPPDFSHADGEHLVGLKQEVWLNDIEYWLLVFAVVMSAQILLLKAQSKEASTPSTVGRVSLYTVTMMLAGDAFLFVTLSFISTLAPNLFPSSLIAAFAALMSIALGIRFVGAVYNVQEPERRERLRLQLAAEEARRPPRLTVSPAEAARAAIARVVAERDGTAVATSGISAVPNQPSSITSPGLVGGAEAPRTQAEIPIIIPSDQDIDAEIEENRAAAPASTAPLLPITNTPANVQTQTPATSSFGALYVKSVMAFTFLLFVSASASSWSKPWRSAYIHLLSLTYLSFWVPQIRRNVIRNCRKALLWRFIIGQSILRLLPFAYFYLREDNFLFADPDWKAFCVYAGWVWIQVWMLVAQEILGPRWGIPKGWTEEGWDYHPILREDNVEAGGLPIGLVQVPNSPTLQRTDSGSSEDRKKKEGTVMSLDCAICMQNLEVPVVAAGEDAAGATGVAGMLARRQYMVTPCRHMFHSQCLEGWMRFRLQCPICRENLPPL
ncbi:RING/U-box [Glarea lozoyensis ATCC 20868]|uniref:DSC E3 ubiquitin ligase complex subunit A n=1 Tax=Glarea lozoyensis (strain ATCC 20868 / MF5171) TaxID=1116229 RepID=S3CT04_GLAL2|nr:RING/U-box [Glarea lozoyensis ATCC 20868]EPE29562.1 RING/U-box [Glarea lozoyensis ATCC 20868]